MKMIVTDWTGSFRRWILPVAMAGIALVMIRGPGNVMDIGSIGLLFLSVLMMARPAIAEETPLSFCLPRFRESLRRGYFAGAAVMGLSGALFALHLWLHSRRGTDDGDLTHAFLPVACGFFVGTAGALVLGTSHLVLPRLARAIPIPLLIPLLLVALVSFVLLDSPTGCPTIAITVCTAVCVFIWVRLGNMACLKRGHRLVIANAAARGRERAAKGGMGPWAHLRDEVTLPSWAESLFQRRLQRAVPI
jgi:hypothetical protein